MSKEAMKLALDALEGLEALLLSMGLTHLIVYGDAEKAITALRQALANEALDRMAENARELGLDYEPAQQEPVAWATQLGDYAHIQWGAKRPEYPVVYEVPLYTSPPEQAGLLREIAALSANALDDYKMIQKLMAEQQPLTDEEIGELKGGYQSGRIGSFVKLIRAIEQAHGIGEKK